MLFEEQISRKPDYYPWATGFIDAIHESFWTHKEFNFASDIQDFKVNLTEQEKGVITRTLSAIGQIEIAVKKFWVKLGENLPHPSITDMGIVFGANEVVHNSAYIRLLEVLELEHIFQDNLKLDVVLGRVNYLKKHTHKYHNDSKKQFVYSLILFTLFIENVSLFSQFYIILWFGRFKNVLKHTGQQVNYTRLDEKIHSLAGIKIIQTLRSEYPELFDKELEDKIIHEIQEAFKCESRVIDWIMEDFSGSRISSAILKEYIKQRFNESLEMIGYKRLFDVEKSAARDFEWADEETDGNLATDFFHRKPVEYSKSNKSFGEEDLF